MKANPTGTCDACGAEDTEVVRDYRLDWTPVMTCADIDACWERRRAAAVPVRTAGSGSATWNSSWQSLRP